LIAHAQARHHGQAQSRSLTPDDIKDGFDRKTCDLVWVDIANPDDEDLTWLRKTFDFHQLALEDVARRHQRAKIEEYPGYAFGVIYAARADTSAQSVVSAELQFFWGASYLVTIHSEPFPEIDDLASRLDEGTLMSVVGSGDKPVVVPDLVYRLLDAIVDGYFPVVDSLADWTEDVEEAMFGGGQPSATLQIIFRLRKEVVQLRKTIAPSREAVNVLLRRDNGLFGNEFIAYFQDVYDHTVRAIDTLDTYRDLLASALDAHLAIVSNDVSQTVKTMTAVTAILMVNALIAGIYGMNFDNFPELHWTYGYPYALSLMASVSLALWLILRRVGWL
jgi:magnesium transporter